MGVRPVGLRHCEGNILYYSLATYTERKLFLRGRGPMATLVEMMTGRGLLALTSLRLSLSWQLVIPVSHLLAPHWPDAQ